jgi:RNA polymerase sigma factor (sigma-70 family)
MATSELSKVIQQLHSAVRLHDSAALTDGQLLARFIERRDEAAFEGLVRRHGPLVLGVCRRVLGNHHDAEDAFQATFLVLARKAAAIVPREMLANWLYGVACQTARNARAATAKRAVKERQVAVMAEAETYQHDDLRADWADLKPRLDQELNLLPEKYRLPIILCDLQGSTRKEAAGRLGWPEGTVSGRLARARTMLAKRLARYGLALSGGSLAEVLSQSVAAARVPTALLVSTVRAASLGAAGKMAAGVISAKVAALVEGVLKAMLLTRLKKTAVLVLLAAALVGLGFGVFADSALVQKTTQVADNPPTTSKAQAQPHSDRFGDPLPAGALQRMGTVQFRPGDWAYGVAFAPDGATVLSLSSSAINQWDAATGKLVRQFQSKGKEKLAFHALALSKDGKTLAAGQMLGEGASTAAVGLWEVATGKLIREIMAEHFLDRIRFSPDGKMLAGITRLAPKQILLWDIAGDQEIAKLQGPADAVAPAFAFSADSKVLAWSTDKTIRLWDVGQRKETRQLVGHQGFIHTLGFSEDGKLLASTGNDQIIRIWAPDTGKELEGLEAAQELPRWETPVHQCAFVPGGQVLAVLDSREGVHFWRLDAGKLMRTIPDKADAFSFSGDGKRLATAHMGAVRLWDVASGKEITSRDGHYARIEAVAVSPDGRLVASGGYDQVIQLWDMATGKPVRKLFYPPQDHIFALAFSPDSQTLASSATGTRDPSIRLWEVASGKKIRKLLAPRANDADGPYHMVFSNDGKVLVAGDRDGFIRHWEVATGKTLRSHGDKPGENPATGALSQDGGFLASGDVDGLLRVWDTATGNNIARFESEKRHSVCAVALSPDNKTLASVDYRGDVCLWEVPAGKKLRSLPGNSTKGDAVLAFSPDGRILATASGGTLHGWEVSTGKKLFQLGKHEGPVTCLTFSSDGKTLVSGSWDTTLLIWDVSPYTKNPSKK